MATKQELLLDETAAGLTHSELDEAAELIQKIRENGTTVLIVEQTMKVIVTISDNIYAINFGQTIGEGAPCKVANNPAVVKACLGEAYAQCQRDRLILWRSSGSLVCFFRSPG